MNARKVQSAQRLAIQLSLLLLLLVGLGALVGSEGLAWSQVQADAGLIADIRLPRTLGACLAGALLGLAGALAQGLFRNPLADPYLLGSASGATLGVASALSLLGVSPMATSDAPISRCFDANFRESFISASSPELRVLRRALSQM